MKSLAWKSTVPPLEDFAPIHREAGHLNINVKSLISQLKNLGQIQHVYTGKSALGPFPKYISQTKKRNAHTARIFYLYYTKMQNAVQEINVGI